MEMGITGEEAYLPRRWNEKLPPFGFRRDANEDSPTGTGPKLELHLGLLDPRVHPNVG
jgi:hypothetical protein